MIEHDHDQRLKEKTLSSIAVPNTSLTSGSLIMQIFFIAFLLIRINNKLLRRGELDQIKPYSKLLSEELIFNPLTILIDKLFFVNR